VDVWGITLAVLRRWYVFIPIFALAVLAAVSAGRGVAPEYEASATAMLTPAPTQPTVANPLVNAQEANTAIGIVLNGPVAQLQVSDSGLTGSFAVTTAARSSVLTIVARSDKSAEDAVATTEAVLDVANQELKVRQEAAGIPAGSQIGLQVLSPPSLASVGTDGALRVQAIIVILGAAAALVVSVLFDDIIGFIRRRRQRRRGKSETAGVGVSTPALPGASIALPPPKQEVRAERRQASRLSLTNGRAAAINGHDRSPGTASAPATSNRPPSMGSRTRP
jgi:hypothetical protein